MSADRAELEPEDPMAQIVKTEWFGRQVSVLMINGKSVTGELSEVTENYIVLTRGSSETQVMVHAIIAVRLAAEKEDEESSKLAAEGSVPPFA